MRTASLAIFTLAMIGPEALAQTAVERFSRQLEQIQRQTTLQADSTVPVDQRTLLDYGGYLSLNYLSTQDPNGQTHVLREYDLVAYGRVNIDGVHEFFGRGMLRWGDFNPGDSFDGEGDDFHALIDRAYYRFDLQRYHAAYEGRLSEDNLVVQAGRQFVYWANGLVLGHVVDGVAVDAKWGILSIGLLAGVTPVHDTVDFDSSRPHFDDHTLRGFYGAMIGLQLTPSHRSYAYILFQQDYNHDHARETGVISTRFDYNTWYIGVGSAGSLGDRLVYAAEFAYESGRGLSNSFTTAGGTLAPINQTYDEVNAWAGDIRLDYLLSDPGRTRLSAEFIVASGDRTRGTTSNTFEGNTPGTRDQAFNAFGLVNTGLAFAPPASNLLALRGGASTFPFPEHHALKRLQIGLDLYAFAKTNPDAPIDEPSGNGRLLGWEPDLFINWQITSDVTLALRYGVFFPTSGTLANDQARQFFFAGLTIAF